MGPRWNIIDLVNCPSFSSSCLGMLLREVPPRTVTSRIPRKCIEHPSSAAFSSSSAPDRFTRVNWSGTGTSPSSDGKNRSRPYRSRTRRRYPNSVVFRRLAINPVLALDGYLAHGEIPTTRSLAFPDGLTITAWIHPNRLWRKQHDLRQAQYESVVDYADGRYLRSRGGTHSAWGCGPRRKQS